MTSVREPGRLAAPAAAAAPVSFRHRPHQHAHGFAGNQHAPGRLGDRSASWAVSRLDRRISSGIGGVGRRRARLRPGRRIVLLVIFLVLAPFPPDAAVRIRRFSRGFGTSRLMVGSVLVVGVVALHSSPAVRLTSVRAGNAAILDAGTDPCQEGCSCLLSLRAIAAATILHLVLWTSMVALRLPDGLRSFGIVEHGFAHAVGLLVVLSFSRSPLPLGRLRRRGGATRERDHADGAYGSRPDLPRRSRSGTGSARWPWVVVAGAVALWIEGSRLRDMQRALDRSRSAGHYVAQVAASPCICARK
jgi:hypothetical protein